MTKLDIVLAVPGLPFNGQNFDKLSIGGSESAGYYMARALAKLGHRVTVFCNTDPVRCSDVDYLPLQMFKDFVRYTSHDVCIVQRMPELFSVPNKARLSLLWCHDLALKRQLPAVLGTSWNYDKLLVLSQFQLDQYKGVYGVDEPFLYKTRNGIDLETVARGKSAFNAQNLPRNRKSLVYAARPERGMDILLGEIMPRVLAKVPDATLFLTTYDNPVEHLADYYQYCRILQHRLGDRVVTLGNLTKEKLYELYHSAGVYAYPVPSKWNTNFKNFDEISCISAMEAMGCGLPMVTTARGALPETLHPEAGVVIKEEIHTDAYYDAFANACVGLITDEQQWQNASDAGVAHAQTLSWDGVAQQWSEMFETEIKANSADYATMANHFWRHSDIYAAKECLKRLPVDDEKSRYVRQRVEEDFKFIESADGFRIQYEKIGATHDPVVIDWSPQEPRYLALRKWLQKMVAKRTEADGLLSILDYGCAHGGYATNLLKDIPGIKITGVDIDLHSIEMAYSFAEKLGVTDRFRGVVGNIDRLSDPQVPEMTEQYDVVLAQEVMEHVPDPRAMLLALEPRVKDGGKIYVTVPFGPWEYPEYLFKWGGKQSPLAPKGHTGYPYRCHIWEFDLQDLHELLDIKGRDSGLTINVMPGGEQPETLEALGWHVIEYVITAENRNKMGSIDLERKLWLNRPRQTVSACIMAGGATVEETLHWCLRSLHPLVDEVVIADCGLSEEAKRIIEMYDSRVKVIKGVDPKVAGFETPRNMALEQCTQDWVVWIDTDEKLAGVEHAFRYLRANHYNGYGLKQHHFACDTQFSPDLPVRMFRNPKITKSGMRWYGMIHEHPETALNAGPGRTLVLPDVHVPHLGYLLEAGRQVRFNRNLPMLQADMAKYPDRLLQKQFVMRDLMLLTGYELRMNGGVITDLHKVRAREVLKIYREHFLGKGFFTNSDPLSYCSQALQILDEGFDVSFQFNADKQESHLNGGVMKARFANTQDAMIEIERRIKDQTLQLDDRYF